MHRAANRIPWVIILVIPTLILAGCGGGDQEEQSQARQPRQMVPASVDTAAPGRETVPEDDPAVAESTTDPAAESTAEPTAASESGGDSGQHAATESTPPPPPAAATRQDRPAIREAAGGIYSLQLGSFRNEDNARMRARMIRELGHDATVEEAWVEGERYHRVFVRGLASRQDAEKLGEDLRVELGINYLVLHR